MQRLFGGLSCVVEQNVGRLKVLAKNRLHAPRERELVPHGLARRHADDVGRDAEARDHANRPTGDGTDDDGLGADVNGHAARGVGNRVEKAPDLELVVAEAGLIVDVLLGLLGDGRHGLHGLHGVFASRRLAGEHDGARAVVDRVCHVGNFRARGAGILDHGLEHLGCGDDARTEQAAGRDELLLDGGELCERDLHAEVAARDHDALAHAADVFNVVNARAVLDFRDDVDRTAAVRA